MELLQQIILLLSEPPGSLIYHLITLFSLQAVFAISYSQWRRQQEDEVALHMVWASGAIFISRIIFLLAGLILEQNSDSGTIFLTPLEYALNTIAVTLLIWSMAPRLARYPRATDILLVAIITISLVMSLFFMQEWQNMVANGQTYYGGTTQATIWLILQLSILAAGLVYLLLKNQTRNALPPIIVAILLLVHVIHLWNSAEFIPSDTNIPYWIRFGFLIAFPLWAAYAYQHTLTPLLTTNSLHKTSVSRFGESLSGAADLIANPQRQSRIVKSLSLSTALMQARFTAIGLQEELNHELLLFQSDLDEVDQVNTRRWALDLSEHGTLKTALTQNQVIELSPNGLGARQLHRFYQEIQLVDGGPLLVHPLIANGSNHGLLIAAGDEEMDTWPADYRPLFAGLARYIAQAIINSQTPRIEAPIITADEQPSLYDSIPSPILIDQVRLNRLETEVDQLRKALSEMEQSKKTAEEKALAAKKQARYLAAALRAAQEGSEPPDPNNQPPITRTTPQQDTIRSPEIEEAE